MSAQNTLQPQLSIIVVSYNTADLTLQTVKSAIDACKHHESGEQTKIPAEIIVVDNDSQDDSVSLLRQLAKTATVPIHLIANKDNNGFSAANNQGIAIAQGNYILLLNSDTIVSPNAFRALLTSFAAFPDNDTTAYLSSYPHSLDRIGIVAATLLNLDGSPQPQGGSFPSLLSLFFHMSMLDDLPVIGRLLPSTQHTGKRATHHASNPELPHVHLKDWVAGTAMMIRKEVIQEVGTLDENIFMYGEDVEFCLRAAKHHWDVLENMDAKITHLGSASAGSERAIIGELTGYLYIWSKHKPSWQYPFAKALLLFGCGLRNFIFGTILGKKEKAGIYQRAIQKLHQV